MHPRSRSRGVLTLTDDWHSVLATNTYGPYYLSRALVRSWLDLPVAVGSGDKLDVRGMKNVNLDKQILMVSSISGIVAMSPQRQTAYNTSKGALTMMAKVWSGSSRRKDS